MGRSLNLRPDFDATSLRKVEGVAAIIARAAVCLQLQRFIRA